MKPEDVGRPRRAKGPDDSAHPRVGSVEQVHLDPRGNGLREADDLSRCESGHVPIDRDHRPSGPQQEGRCRAFGDKRGSRRRLPEYIIESFPATMGDQSLRDDDALPPSLHELLAEHEGSVARMGLGDLHSIPWIRATNFPQPCHRGSAVGSPYRAS